MTFDFDHLHPRDVEAYLYSKGWRRYKPDRNDKLLGWVKGKYYCETPCASKYADYGRRLSEALRMVAREEGRPLPEDQVASDIVCAASAPVLVTMPIKIE